MVACDELKCIEQIYNELQSFNFALAVSRWQFNRSVKLLVFDNVCKTLCANREKRMAGEITVSKEITNLYREILELIVEAEDALEKTMFWQLLARSEISVKINALKEAKTIIVNNVHKANLLQ